MHVVAVTPFYPPGSRVGAWLATHECLRALHGRGHDVRVHRYLSHGPDYELEGITVSGGYGIEDSVKAADVVVSHLGDDGLAAKLAHEHRKPLVRMVHGWCPGARERLHGCDLAVFNSEAARVEFSNGEPHIVVHPVTRPEWHRTSPGGAFTLVNLAKGGDLFRLLALSFPELPFLGVRGGYGRQALQMPSNVTVRNMTLNMREDVWQHTRVLLMPSERETWGMVGVEALCSGIPVVAADTPGLMESLGSGAYRFLDCRDLASWQLAVDNLCEPDVWKLASQQARFRWLEIEAGQAAGLALFVESVEALA